MEQAFIEEVRAFYEEALRAYWTRKYEAYQRDEEIEERFLQAQEIEFTTKGPLKNSLEEAYLYYFQDVQQADFGNVYLLRQEVSDRVTYAVHVTTDGDDGWLEVYGGLGQLLGAARRYIELLAWDHVYCVR